ncbi:kinase-like domain-containing protein [Aspergillus californicus]
MSLPYETKEFAVFVSWRLPRIQTQTWACPCSQISIPKTAPMVHRPESVLRYFDANPDGTLVEYLAELMGQHPSAVFTASLQEQGKHIVPVEQLQSAVDLTPDRLNSKVLQISPSTVLKVGWRVGMHEAEALMLLAAKTTVPVPKVLSAYTIGDIGFILMSKIEGETLGSCWDSLSPEELHGVGRQLKSYVAQWRGLGSCFLGTVDSGPCQDILFNHPWDYKSSKTYGPFNSVEEYKAGVIEALRQSRPPGIWYEKEEALREKILSFAYTKSTFPGVLTHGDLHEGNIMIKDGVVSGIVDWGESGYSPREREFFAAKRKSLDDCWTEIIHYAIPFLKEEYELMDEIDRSMMRYSPV